MRRQGASRFASLAVIALVLSGASGGKATAGINDLIVTNLGDGAIHEFNPNTGAPVASFGGPPNLFNAVGAAVGPDQNIYVGDLDGNLIQQYSGTTGSFIKTFVASGSGGLTGPYGEAFGGPGNDLYVSSFASNQVLEYNGSTGAFVKALGAGSPLQSPTGLTFGPDGNLYVASSATNQIVEFNPTTGAFIRALSGVVTAPAGLAFGNGSLYVTDGLSGSSTFYRLDPVSGAVLQTFSDPAHLNAPGGIVVTPSGNVLIASVNTNAIVEYNSAGQYLTTLVAGSGLNTPLSLVLASPPAVPEPPALALLAIGLGGMWFHRSAGRTRSGTRGA